MDIHSYRPSRRTFLQAATAGVLAPAIAARSVAATETELAADRISAAGLPAGFSIVDAHIHLWDLSRYAVPWIAGNPILNQSYVLQDFKAQSAGLGVGTMVYVQAAWASEYSLLEADYVTNLAAHDSLVQGMVAYAPLEYGEQVRSYLDSLMVHGTFIKGVRRGLPSPSDTTFPVDRFIRGIQILPEYGLSFDILGKGTPHLDMAIKIAQSAPKQEMIADERLGPKMQSLAGAAANDLWEGILRMAAGLQSSSVVVGSSSKMSVTEQARHIGLAWERMPEPRPRVTLEIFNSSGQEQIFYLGPHAPRLTPKEIDLLHKLWVNISDNLDGEEIHHHDIVHFALTEVERQIANGQRDEVLLRIRDHLRGIKDHRLPPP